MATPPKRAAGKTAKKAARDTSKPKAARIGRAKAPTKATKTNADERKKAVAGSGKKASKHVQLRNPISDRYVKLETKTGRVVAQKRTSGPYQGVPVVK